MIYHSISSSLVSVASVGPAKNKKSPAKLGEPRAKCAKALFHGVENDGVVGA